MLATLICFIKERGTLNMLTKKITYTDYNGTERTEDFYFNLNKAELTELEFGTTGGLATMIQRIVAAQDTPSIIKVFKEIILKAYGEKSPDGKRFIKSEEISTAFSQTEAYSTLFMELAYDDEAAAKFINAIIPADLDPSKAEQKANLDKITK